MMTKISKTLDFIAQFREAGTTNCFKNGMCYWFAHILQTRFSDDAPVIVYAPVDNHFGCMIENYVFDIEGDVTFQYEWVLWDAYQTIDPLHTARLYRDCVYKERN